MKREKALLPVDVRRSKTSLLKLPKCKGNADSGNEIAGVTSVTARTRDLQPRTSCAGKVNTIKGRD